MEAVRQALGVEQVALYGTSYGTKLALAYAVRYPAHVERLVLDSVLPLDGPDPFTRDIIGATPRVLRALCAESVCDGITSNPVGDVAALVKRLERGPIRGRVVGGDGRGRMRRLGRLRLLRILVDGDLDPSLRAEFPSAVRSADRGDSAPLLRLAHRTLIGERVSEPPEDFSAALYVATTCTDGPLPWARSTLPADRSRLAYRQAASTPDAGFYPFDRATGAASDTVELCTSWPAPGRQPTGPGGLPGLGDLRGALPNVPTLILSGDDDLRTPREGATRVAAQIPRATVVSLPGTGHSALLNDLSLCSNEAVSLFFEDRPIGTSCPRFGQELRKLLLVFFLPVPLAPTSLREVPRAFRVRGAPVDARCLPRKRSRTPFSSSSMPPSRAPSRGLRRSGASAPAGSGGTARSSGTGMYLASPSPRSAAGESARAGGWCAYLNRALSSGRRTRLSRAAGPRQQKTDNQGPPRAAPDQDRPAQGAEAASSSGARQVVGRARPPTRAHRSHESPGSLRTSVGKRAPDAILSGNRARRKRGLFL